VKCTELAQSGQHIFQDLYGMTEKKPEDNHSPD